MEIVAPFAGAWIKIVLAIYIPSIFMSLPSRERGLKLYILVISTGYKLSLPSRERGLK